MGSQHGEALYEAAKAVMAKAYAPYSQFPVGAAILGASGTIYAGCNIENVAFPQSACAEANAIAHMVVAGETKLLEVAVIAEKQPLITPCGGCRQRIAEFGNADTKIHLCDMSGIGETVTLGEILPKAFDSEAL